MRLTVPDTYVQEVFLAQLVIIALRLAVQRISLDSCSDFVAFVTLFYVFSEIQDNVSNVQYRG